MMQTRKALALMLITVAATIFGISIFSFSAFEDLTTDEEVTAPAFCGFRHPWLNILTDEQRATLKERIEEKREEVKAQLEVWGIEVPMQQCQMTLLDSLKDEQKEELQKMKKEYQDAVNAKLEEQGIEVQEFGPTRVWHGIS